MLGCQALSCIVPKMGGEHSIGQIDMITHPDRQFAKGIVDSPVITSVSRFGELGHLYTPRPVLAFMPLEAGISRTTHQTLFICEMT